MFKNSKIILRYPQYKSIIEKYMNLDEFNGLSHDTMRAKRVTVTSLCNYLGDNEVSSLNQCKHSHVADFMESISMLSTATKSGKTFILRHFFNFLYHEKIILYSGNELFPVIVTNKRDRILSFYTEDEVKKLVSCIDNTTPKGKHDLIVVLLAAELGTRSGDICSIKTTYSISFIASIAYTW